MTTDSGGQAANLETTNGAHEAPVSSDGRDWEAEARDLGWIPEDEFKDGRRPAKFKTAQEFVEDIPPYIKKLLEKAEQRSTDRIAKIERLNEKTIERLASIHQKEIAELRAQKKQAIAAGNVDLVESLDTEIDRRREEAPLTDDPKAQRAKAEQAFADANPWYGSNRKMTAFARGLSQDLAATAEQAGKPLAYDDNIKQVLIAVREEFPEYFNKAAAANGHAAVDGGSDAPAPSRSDPFARLSAAEREKATADMKKYPKIYPTKQSWMDEYQS